MAWAFGIGGVLVWVVDSNEANAICAVGHTFDNLFACKQIQNTADLALLIGIVGIAIGIILTIMALRDS